MEPKAKVNLLGEELDQADLERYLDLLDSARSAQVHAYSPYSGFRVGATLLAKDGEKIQACNVENASYGLTLCAEQSAIAKAVSRGYRPGDLEAIAITASGLNFSPCGACRQIIFEFGGDIMVLFEFNGEVFLRRAKELLPQGYAETRR